jgi:Protein of unknown function (DUF4031)
MVSDSNLDELHEMARLLSIPAWVFQGDHYDLHEGLRAMAVRQGAIEVPSRELVARLRASGLRVTPAARRANTDGHR